MLVLRNRPYPRASPVLYDDVLERAVVVDEGAWWLQRVRGHNWKYKTAYPASPSYSYGQSPSQIIAIGVPDDDPWIWRTQRWPPPPRPVTDDDPLFTVVAVDDGAWWLQRIRGHDWKYRTAYPGVPRYGQTNDSPSAAQQATTRIDEDYQYTSSTQRVWPISRAGVLHDDTVVSPSLSVDEEAFFSYRNRISGWKLFYPARRGGSTDSNPVPVVFGRDDDSWQPAAQKLWTLSRPITDDEILGLTPAFGVDDDVPFTYRNRISAWKLFYPSRRGGSTDNSAPILPLGVDEDSWLHPKQNLWKLSQAITDDEVYVVNASEDYLWINVQNFPETPLVAVTDDEILAPEASLGVEDEFYWQWPSTASWPLIGPVIDDEILWFESPPEELPPSIINVGGGAEITWKDHVLAKFKYNELKLELELGQRKERRLLSEKKKIETKLRQPAARLSPPKAVLTKYSRVNEELEEAKQDIFRLNEYYKNAADLLRNIELALREKRRDEDDEDDDAEAAMLLS